MATGKQGFVRAVETQHSVSAQREKDMRVQAPLTAMYIQSVPGLQTYPQAHPGAVQDTAVIPLSVPVMCSSQTLPLLTLHIAGGAALQQQRPETPVSSSRSRSSGKHVCPHCQRDCLKPSVLEKHLRCHTGERPYPCITCGISFKTQSNLYKHKRTQAHARLSSESSKGDFSSQESMESSRETCTSPSLELQSEDSVELNNSNSVSAAATMTTVSSAQVCSVERKTGFGTEWALRKAAVVGLIASPAHGQQEILDPPSQSGQMLTEVKSGAASVQTKSSAGDGHAPLTPNRTPLQRQEALFPKLSRGKTQVSSHDSTDSGFSESSEQHLVSSPVDNMHDRSMESLTESSMELQEPGSAEKPSDVATEDNKGKVSVQEKQKLEEHISKLISENSVLVDDKHLVNVRPRKTMLYKQGSIDLPMPYTYKDSFHFEMKSSKQVSNSLKQDVRGRPAYSSVPTQYSSLEHAPLTRSSSLPFSMGIQNRDRTASPFQGETTPLSRRCSAGNINPFKSVDQHAPSHRSLVRQEAMDCLPSAEGSPVDRGSHSTLSSEGDCTDLAPEALRKPQGRRKKAQRFAYNKWYMYGDGTFKKLYNTEKDSLLKTRKSTTGLEQRESQAIQMSKQTDITPAVSVSFASCSAVCLPPAVNVHAAQTSSQVISSYVLLQSPQIKQSAMPSQSCLAEQTNLSSSNSEANLTKKMEEKDKKTGTQHSCPVPSERKKQKTEEDLSASVENTDKMVRQQCDLTSGSGQTNTNLCSLMNQSPQSAVGDGSQRSSLAALQKDNRLNLYRQGSFTDPSSANQKQTLFKRHSSPLFVTSVAGTSGLPSASLSASSVTQAKSSFLPKYQLKIPCSTDGVSDPCLGNSSSQNLTSSKQPFRQSHPPTQQVHPETSLPSASQNQSATVKSSGQDHEVCLGTITVNRTSSLTSVTEQNANTISDIQTQYRTDTCTSVSTTSVMNMPVSSIAYSTPTNTLIHSQFAAHTVHNMSAGSVSSVLSQPLQTFTALGQNQSVAVSTTHCTISPMSHTSQLTKKTTTDSACTALIEQNNSAASIVISRQTSGPTVDTHVSVCQNPTDGSPLEISHTTGVQFEGKMLLMNDSLQSLAQDTFYVRTADLQIVMQLISDEQLALIEPQIETHNSKMEGQSFLSKDAETSGAGTIQTGVPQEKLKHCSGDTGTKLYTVPGNVNGCNFSKMPDITTTAFKPTSTESAIDSTKAIFGLHSQNYLTNTGQVGVTSGLSSKAEQHISAVPESKPSPEPLKSISAASELNTVAKDMVSSGCDCVNASYFKQRSAAKLGGLSLTTKTATTTQSLPMTSNSSVHSRVSTNQSEFAMSGEGQSSPDIAGGPGAIYTFAASAKSTEKSFLSEDTVLVNTLQTMDSTSQSESMIIEQHESLHLVSNTSKPTEGESLQKKTSASEALLISLTPIKAALSSQEDLLPNAKQSHHKSTCASLTPARPASLGKVISHTTCQSKPINQKGTCSNDRPKLKESKGNKVNCPVQSSVQHLTHQDSFTLGGKVSRRNSKESKALRARHSPSTGAHFESDRPVSKCTQEEHMKCGDATCGKPYISHVPYSGPQLGGSLQTSQHQWEAGTRSQGWVPLEPESGGVDEQRVGTKGAADTKNTSPELEDHARKNNEEGAIRSDEGNGTAEKPHPCLSQFMTKVSQDTSLLAQFEASGVSDNTTATLCEEISLSHDFGQREGAYSDSSEQVIKSDNRVKGPPKLITQSKAKEKDQPESQEKATSLVTVQSDMKHHQPSCGHTIQDVKREVQVKILATQPCQSMSSDTVKPSVPNESFMTVRTSNESCQMINAIPVHTNPNSTNLTINYVIPFNPSHNNPADPNLPQCHSGGNYVEENESSSSDDEGKLVIELE